jgi:GTP cyclohydrolase II
MSNLKLVATVNFPTRWAQFRLLAFESSYARAGRPEQKQTALALLAGDISVSAPIVRIHSQCMTGDVFHSLRCDCHDQLHLALRSIAASGAGILIYEHQEGRGIGIMEKLKAYELQELGLDTIEANLYLGHEVDLRDYRLAADILLWLQVRAVRLVTNNPEKIAALRSSGIEVLERLSADVPADRWSAPYLRTKQEKLGHLIGVHPELSAEQEQSCGSSSGQNR